MKQCRGAQRFHFDFTEAELFRNFDGVNFDALQMIGRGLVFRFDRQGQGFDGTSLQSGDFNGVRALLLGAFLGFLEPQDI